MKAVWIKEFGADNGLEIGDVPDLERPLGSIVLVKVKAAGLNRADLLQQKGFYPPPAGFSDRIPGLEFAGEVADVGGDVSGFSVGDRVFGITAGEAQAEFINIDESQLMIIPPSLDFVNAAAIPEAFITAHDALFTQAELAAGDWVLIHAVGSGVGVAALQLAKIKNVSVIGTSRTSEKLERCREFGLDFGIVTAAEAKFSDQVNELRNSVGVNGILDLVGASYFAENLNCIAPRGRIILVGLTGGAAANFDLRTAIRKRVSIIGTVLRSRSSDEKAHATKLFATDVLSHFADGLLRPVVDRAFPFTQVRDAYRLLASNETFGKVVIEF